MKVTIEVIRRGKCHYDVKLDGRLAYEDLSEAGLQDIFMQLFNAAKE